MEFKIDTSTLEQVDQNDFISAAMSKLSIAPISHCKHIGSVIAFDGYIVNSISSPSLTAVTHDRKVLGQNAIEILLSKNNKAEKNNFLAKPKIIERGSVYEIKKKA